MSRDLTETAPDSGLLSARSGAASGGAGISRRPAFFLVFVVILVTAFGRPLFSVFSNALGNDPNSELNSYIVLIPFVSLYFLHLERRNLSVDYQTSAGWAVPPFVMAAVAMFFLFAGERLARLSPNDRLSVSTLAFVGFFWTGGFVILGRKWMATAAFPMLFLIFLTPLPDLVVYWMELGLRWLSADAASLFFALTGTPVLRTGTVFQLPGITIEVAQECSGIRSSWVLFITSLVAAQLFLAKASSKAALIASVIPLGILRNGFRIMVIGLLCVHVDPDMIHSIIHRKGGPIFFALSLVPLLGLLWFLRKRELAITRKPDAAVGLR